MKNLTVVLLPITFLFAACGGHEETANVTASSSSAPVVSSSTGAPVPENTASTPVPTPAATASTSPVAATTPPEPPIAVSPTGKGLAVTNYARPNATKPSPIIIQQARPNQAINLAEVLAAIPRITPQEAKAEVDSGKALIVDVRGIARSQIKGSRHIPLAQLPMLLNSLPRDKEIITYCTCPHEEEATRGALTLTQAGFKKTVTLGGGLHAWERAGYPTEMAQ